MTHNRSGSQYSNSDSRSDRTANCVGTAKTSVHIVSLYPVLECKIHNLGSYVFKPKYLRNVMARWLTESLA